MWCCIGSEPADTVRAKTESGPGSLSIEFHMAFSRPQQGMKMAWVSPVEGVTSLDFEPAIEFASCRGEAQRIVRLDNE
jgi:hypothetical protein